VCGMLKIFRVNDTAEQANAQAQDSMRFVLTL
jgi:hypothetical protein